MYQPSPQTAQQPQFGGPPLIAAQNLAPGMNVYGVNSTLAGYPFSPPGGDVYMGSRQRQR